MVIKVVINVCQTQWIGRGLGVHRELGIVLYQLQLINQSIFQFEHN